MTITPHTTCPAFHQSVPLSYSEVACFVPVAKSSPKDVVEREKTAQSFNLSIKSTVKEISNTSSQNEFLVLEYPYSVTLFWIFSPSSSYSQRDRTIVSSCHSICKSSLVLPTSLFCCISLSNLSGAELLTQVVCFVDHCYVVPIESTSLPCCSISFKTSCLSVSLFAFDPVSFVWRESRYVSSVSGLPWTSVSFCALLPTRVRWLRETQSTTHSIAYVHHVQSRK